MGNSNFIMSSSHPEHPFCSRLRGMGAWPSLVGIAIGEIAIYGRGPYSWVWSEAVGMASWTLVGMFLRESLIS